KFCCRNALARPELPGACPDFALGSPHRPLIQGIRHGWRRRMTDHKNRSKTNLMARMGAAAFVIAGAVALFLTFSGAQELILRVTAAPDGKAELITSVLAFGFVLLGPVLLLALLLLTPRPWLPDAIDRLLHPARHKADHHAPSHMHVRS